MAGLRTLNPVNKVQNVLSIVSDEVSRQEVLVGQNADMCGW